MEPNDAITISQLSAFNCSNIIILLHAARLLQNYCLIARNLLVLQRPNNDNQSQHLLTELMMIRHFNGHHLTNLMTNKTVQENVSWEEPHDLNGLWPWRLQPLKTEIKTTCPAYWIILSLFYYFISLFWHIVKFNLLLIIKPREALKKCNKCFTSTNPSLSIGITPHF